MADQFNDWDVTRRSNLPRRFEWDYPRNRGNYEMASDYEPYWTYAEWWYIPGPYTGKGPRGYERSDERIKDEVCSRLAQSGDLDASDMQVDVQNGEVTLTGTVDSRQNKRLAEYIAESVFGVEDVHNELRINKNQPQLTQQNQQQTQQQNQTSTQEHPRTETGQMERTGEAGTTQSPEMYGHNENREMIREGMDVVGSLGKRLGRVKELRQNDFLLDRPMARDLHVPLSAVQQVSRDQVQLNIADDKIDRQGWPQSPLFGAPPPPA